MSEHATCALCGLEGHDDVIRIGLVEWKDPIGATWEAVYRCRDRIACRLRVEASRDELDQPLTWPVIDGERDREAWEKRSEAPAPPAPAAAASTPAPAAVAVAERPAAPAVPAEPPTWVAPFADEPEEDEPWP